MSKLHVLSHLSYLNISSDSIQLSNDAAIIFQIQTLKRLIINSFGWTGLQFDPPPIHPLAQLEYLELSSCPITTLLELLKYVDSSIKHLKVQLRHDSRQSEILGSPMGTDQWLSRYPFSGKYSINILCAHSVSCNLFLFNSLIASYRNKILLFTIDAFLFAFAIISSSDAFDIYYINL